MMSTRRTLLTFGVLVALAAPATVLAQAESITIGPTTPPSYDKLEVTWEVAGGTSATVTGWEVFYREDEAVGTAQNATGSMTRTGRNPAGAETMIKFTLTGLKSGTEYHAAIAPIDGGTIGALVASPDQDAETTGDQGGTTAVAGAPAPARNVTATGGDKTFTVMWEAPFAGETGLTIKEYRVQKREVAGNLFGDWVPPIPGAAADASINADGKKVDGDETMITFEGLENGVTYQARVLAINSADVKGPYTIMDDDMSTPGDEAAMVGGDDMEDDPMDDMTGTPALPLFGILALFAGLLAAGRARLRR